MCSHHSRKVRRGNKIYTINVPRLVFSLTLIFALIAGGIFFVVRGAKKLARRAAFEDRFSALYISEFPDEEKEVTRCIVLSAGHGGDDPGACVGDVMEKDINLSITKLVQQMLEEKGYTVLMTRTTDTEADNTTAIAEANANGVDMLVAIHQNIVENAPEASGIETWYEEGKSDSQYLAQVMQDALITATGAVDRGIKSDQSFELTRETAMPSVLIETGFLSNETERNNLQNEEYQRRIAEGIVAGIEAYFSREGLPASTFSFDEK
ncbi:MAG: N-acetylmuramoyl-L-alanine amidase [Clostridia bacterium]|nr:N-acetylmuramoyl-L-alanine amidase [Clostridia bacterium]